VIQLAGTLDFWLTRASRPLGDLGLPGHPDKLQGRAQFGGRGWSAGAATGGREIDSHPEWTIQPIPHVRGGPSHWAPCTSLTARTKELKET